MALLETNAVSQRFDRREVLKAVSLTVERGEVLAVIGPTGCGKTTLLRLIDQLDAPASGKVLFNGEEVTPRLRTPVRRLISMVLQKPVVFDSSVYDNVAYPLRVRKHDRKALPEKVNAMLRTVGLDGYGRRRARTLSGGETQKVALARALITDPQLLLLDEPTANLDPVSLEAIEDLILRLNRENGMAIIIATHEMAQGQRLAHRIGVMMEGELIQVGRPEVIFYAPTDLRVARFVGVENILTGCTAGGDGRPARIEVNGQTIEARTDLPAGEPVHVCIRPEEVAISLEAPSAAGRNSFPGVVRRIALSGPLARVEMDCGLSLVSLLPMRSVEDLGLKVGQPCFAAFRPSAVHTIVPTSPERAPQR